MRSCAISISIAAYSLTASSVSAADFFELSPGQLTTAHADWDVATEGCRKCHDLGKGVTDALCLDCHAHGSLRDAIAKGRGLHSTFKGACRTCHTEHKGRDALIVNWNAVGGRQRFEHTRTGFDLTGQHDKVACTACHKRKLQSGRTSFVDVSPSCDGCHKNPHRFTNGDLRASCTKCHDPGVAKKLRTADLFFDHGKRTGVPLNGRHGQLDCVRCHANAKMTMPASGGRTCSSSGCHRSPHGPAFASAKCTDCHGNKDSWKEVDFDHDKTGFPLRGQHNTKNCGACHKKKRGRDRRTGLEGGITSEEIERVMRKERIANASGNRDKPSPVCQSCHNDPHKKRFEKILATAFLDEFNPNPSAGCKVCHGLGGSRKVQFPHDKETKFPLTGAHATLACRRCHRGSSPSVFERFPTNQCQDCHQHTNAHNGEFKDKRCLDCHREGGSKQMKFDHQRDARFATTGFHREIEQKGECKKCHPKAARGGKTTVSEFRTGKLACADCHEDFHKGTLGKNCTVCHAVDVHFKETEQKFDHDKRTRFPLVEKHKEAPCEKCHPKPAGRAVLNYRNNKLACFDCHEKDDKHALKLGKQCDKCHTPTKGAPRFDHEKMTSFARTGKHLDAQCGHCHRSKFPEGPPRLGWTKGDPKPGLDQKFPVPGRECRECHFDVHAGDYGPSCDSCHDTTSFKTASRAVHDTGAFRLEGTHDLISCARCHEPKRPLRGLGILCGECHRAKDAHNNALGEMCGKCHSQIEWLPARFNHATTSFPLRGAHLTARCNDCHTIGVYAGTPRECGICHMSAAMRVSDPRHTVSFNDCQNCHSEIAFAAVRRYHPWFTLIGAHAVTRCSACHVGAQYAGTPHVCIGCHRADYLNPSNKPNHAAAGFSEDCETCHTFASWVPAKMPR
jgi:hypothetical protein